MFPLDRVAQYIESIGDDEIMQLGGAVPTFLTAAAAASLSGIPPLWQSGYLIMTPDAQWELGIGTFDAEGYLARSRVLRSSNANARIEIPELTATSNIVYAVQTALSAPAVTMTGLQDDEFSELDPAQGAQAYSSGSTALGAMAVAQGSNTTAIGAEAYALARYSSAIGRGSASRVVGAVHLGLWALTWGGYAETSGATETTAVGISGDKFVPWSVAAYVLDINVVARRTSPTPALYAATMKAAVLRTSAEDLPILVGTSGKTVIAQSAGVTCDFDLGIDSDLVQVDGSLEVNGSVAVLVTGAASETWKWAVSIRAAEQAD
ncbi:hypothetical protein [Methyloversatilis sp.]|uniref:hypothetical protein n=1 Tax=Methyloversatilis sp. TaxID=2569862 RepID=UPI003D26A9F7